MIKICRISKSFKDVKAIDDVSFILPDKGMVFILGDSGSGKSTLCNLIAGFLKIDEGSIEVDKEKVETLKGKKLDKYHSQKIGFIFQDYSLIESSSVLDNLLIGGKLAKKDKDKSISALDKVGLKGYEYRKVSSLSGGEKQRVAISRAIIKSPPIILADEPCGNLDEGNSKLILDILKKMSEDSLIIIVSHNTDDAYYYGDRVLTLEKGRLKEDLSFSNDNEQFEGYQYVDSSRYEEGNNFSKVNKAIEANSIKGIYRRKDCFSPTKEVPTEEVDKHEVRKKNAFVYPLVKFFSKSYFRIFAFSFIISIILGIFSISYSIASFSSDETLARIVDEQNLTSLCMVKGRNYNDSLIKSYTFPMEENDLEDIYEAGYEGNAYPLIRFGLNCWGEAGLLASETRISVTHFEDYFINNMGGVLLCPESFIISSLELENLSINPKLDSEQDGIYITDYLADCFIHYNDEFKTHENVLGLYLNSRRNRIYVKGIIETGYKDKLAPLFKAHEETGTAYSTLFSSKDYSPYFDYIRDHLAIGYYTGKVFYSLMEQQCNYIYKSTVYITDSNGLLNLNYSYKYITYCDLLEDDELLTSTYILQNAFPDLEETAIEDYINDSWSNTFFYQGYGSSSDKYDGLDNLLERSFNKFYVEASHPDYFLDTANFGVQRGKDDYIYVSKNVFDSMAKEDAYTYAYYLDNVDSASKIRTSIKNSNSIYLSSSSSDAIDKVESATKMFGSLFEILCFAGAIISIALILYYAVSSVSSSRYGIGVARSQGYGGGELSLYYLGGIMIFYISSIIVYLISYGLMVFFINNLVIDALAKSHRSVSLLTEYGLFDFDMGLALFVLLILLASILAISLLCLYILRKVRVADILRKKE